ncbi:MAG: hcnB [Bradyrhizobium sp.]|nr:hcnB [Bradyrhizobium sp.]
MTVDAHAIDGKIHAPEERFDLVVVGAGTSGTAAAIDAALAGGRVLLIDENPVPGSLIGTDVPYFFGGRATAAVQLQSRMVEQLFATNPRLEEAFEAGVDVRLGTVAWGLYVTGPAMRALPGPMLGIADAERARMIGFDRLVLATGARDVVLGFAGWDQPGVMGAQGFAALLTRYDAFAGRRILVVGSDRLGLETALLAVEHGIEVAGIVEIADAAQGPADLAARVVGAGIPLLLNMTIASAAGGADGVECVTLADGKEVACDTIVLAIGVEPATELLLAAEAVPVDLISLVGDCAETKAPAPKRLTAWADALGRHAPDDVIVCQCEEVTRADLIGVQPPRYLDRSARIAARSLATLAADGPSHPDQIKRLTRAGMGQCQGRRCREQVRCILAKADGIPLDQVPVASFRAPVRPIPLGVLADWDERPDMEAGWDVWFGIPTQWTPYAVIGTPAEADHVSGLSGNMHV